MWVWGRREDRVNTKERWRCERWCYAVTRIRRWLPTRLDWHLKDPLMSFNPHSSPRSVTLLLREIIMSITGGKPLSVFGGAEISLWDDKWRRRSVCVLHKFKSIKLSFKRLDENFLLFWCRYWKFFTWKWFLVVGGISPGSKCSIQGTVSAHLSPDIAAELGCKDVHALLPSIITRPNEYWFLASEYSELNVFDR